MSEIKISVEHLVSPEPDSCTYGGDFWGKDVCRYHTHRDRTHGRKAPTEWAVPKCTLFDTWLDRPYKKCDECRKACKVAQGERIKREQDWIPVEERLPGTQKVLITDGEIVMRGYRRPDGTWKYGVEPEEVFSKLSSIGVIAWRPLPEPYRPKDELRGDADV